MLLKPGDPGIMANDPGADSGLKYHSPNATYAAFKPIGDSDRNTRDSRTAAAVAMTLARRADY